MMRLPRFVVVLLFATIILFLLWLGWAVVALPQGTFYPRLVAPTPVGLVNSEPITLSFADLNADPYGWRNRLLRVSGNFTPLARVACAPYKGVHPHWAIVNEGLKMDIEGLNELLAIAPEGGEVTIEGIWRLYEGPLGCGKEPARGAVWYLEAKRLIAPNPVVFEPNSGLGQIAFQNIGAGAVTSTPTAEGTPDLTAGEGDAAVPTPTASPIGTTPTPAVGTGGNAGNPTPIPTPSATARSGIPTPGSGGGNAGETTTSGSANPTATPSGGTPASTVVPGTPLPTSPAGGYGGGGGATTIPGTPLPTIPSGGY